MGRKGTIFHLFAVYYQRSLLCISNRSIICDYYYLMRIYSFVGINILLLTNVAYIFTWDFLLDLLTVISHRQLVNSHSHHIHTQSDWTSEPGISRYLYFGLEIFELFLGYPKQLFSFNLFVIFFSPKLCKLFLLAELAQFFEIPSKN